MLNLPSGEIDIVAGFTDTFLSSSIFLAVGKLRAKPVMSAIFVRSAAAGIPIA